MQFTRTLKRGMTGTDVFYIKEKLFSETQNIVKGGLSYGNANINCNAFYCYVVCY